MYTFEEILAQSTDTPSAKKTRTFEEIVASASDRPYTFMSNDEVDDWFATTGEIGTKADDYYRTTGWKAPNTAYTTALDNQLSSASKVRQYFVANKDHLQDPNTTLREFDAYVSGLRSLRKNITAANALYGNYENETAYQEAEAAAKLYQQRATYDLEGTAGAFLEKDDLVKRRLDYNAAYERLVSEQEDALRNAPKSTLVGTSHRDYEAEAKAIVDNDLAYLATLDPNSQEYRDNVGTGAFALYKQKQVIDDTLKRFGFNGFDDYDAFYETYTQEAHERKVAAYTQKGIALYSDATEAADFAEKSRYDPSLP